jgi:hypothetical protein
LELLSHPSDAQTEIQSAARQDVDGRGLFRQEQRLSLGKDADSGAESDVAGHCGQEGQARERVHGAEAALSDEGLFAIGGLG